MFDLKTIKSALEQLESERGISKEKIIEAIEDSLAAAYKKEYGKRGQIIKANFDINSGKTELYQIKTVVDDSMVYTVDDDAEDFSDPKKEEDEEETRVRFNPEQHILLEDAQIIKKGVKLEEEIVFPLEEKGEYGRIAAQTAKQVIIQRIREAEHVSAMSEFEKRKGEIISGTVQRIERGNIYVDLGRIIGVIPKNEQIPGEYYKQGDRIRAYLYAIDETPRDVTLKLSRSHPQYLYKLFELEVPEIANEIVEIKSIAREPGLRSKIAVSSNDENVDPVGSCVGQRGVRIATIMSELMGEKIDVIEWSEDTETFIERSISPGEVLSVELDEKNKNAIINVSPDQYSLAIGKGGQNARLSAKLTGWKIDIKQEGEGVEEENSKKTKDNSDKSMGNDVSKGEGNKNKKKKQDEEK